MERVPTTAEGLKVLEDELKQLKSVERPATKSTNSSAAARSASLASGRRGVTRAA